MVGVTTAVATGRVLGSKQKSSIGQGDVMSIRTATALLGEFPRAKITFIAHQIETIVNLFVARLIDDIGFVRVGHLDLNGKKEKKKKTRLTFVNTNAVC